MRCLQIVKMFGENPFFGGVHLMIAQRRDKTTYVIKLKIALI